MKFAQELKLVEELTYYDRPLICLYVDQTNGQHWLAAWIDESQEHVWWHMIAISDENVLKYLEEDIDKSMTLLEVIEAAPAIYRVMANTFDYGSILEGEKLDVIEGEYLPLPGSYCHTSTYVAWEARQKAAAEAVAPTILSEPVPLRSPVVAAELPGHSLDWPELDTVPSELLDVGCPWERTNFL